MGAGTSRGYSWFCYNTSHLVNGREAQDLILCPTLMTEQFPMNFLSSHNDLLIRPGQCLWCNVAGLAQLLISLNGVCLVSLMAPF